MVYLANVDLERADRHQTDFLIIGSGIGGLFSALNLCKQGRVTLLTKEKPRDCNTEYAQGGIAAVVKDEDTPRLHIQDTLEAGAGLCNPEAVDILVHEGIECIEELIALGVDFDQEGDRLSLSREGAHSCRRILHAGGDATGAEIRGTLMQALDSRSEIELIPDIFVVDLLVAGNRCHGVLAFDKRQKRYVIYSAPAVILATGGAGQLYRDTSNPEVATGDGIAMAYRAGAEVMDLEFVQFHPTALASEGRQNFLISEAVRGEGGVLRNSRGERFMPTYHRLADLAPRDIVTRAIYNEMKKAGTDHVELDITGKPPEFIERRFPTIYRTCREQGIDISQEPIPVAPAAHYLMGGIRITTSGETSICGLFACGETATCGVHGANRLASNSLLEGLVFSRRMAERAAVYYSAADREPLELGKFFGEDRRRKAISPQAITKGKQKIQDIMTEHVGIIRNGPDLEGVFASLKSLQRYLHRDPGQPAGYELQNMIILAGLIARSALIRRESRGAHYRRDYPESRSEWRKHIILHKKREWEGVELAT